MTAVVRAAVLGSGVMGSGIAQVLALAGLEVVGYDPSEDALEKARVGVDSGRFGVQGAVARGKLTADDAAAALGRLSFTSDLSAAVADADLVLEAVPERLDLKLQVFADLGAQCRSDAILCSNSSGFPVQAMAAVTAHPERVIGWHWASPAPVMKMAEIVTHRGTAAAVTETVVDLATRCGKNPVVVKDTAMHWGYVANRIYFAMIAEAQRVMAEGIATAEQIDQLMVDCYRWPSGPFGMTRGAGSGWA